MGLSPLGTLHCISPRSWMIMNVEGSGMAGRGNRYTRRKPTLAPPSSPQIPRILWEGHSVDGWGAMLKAGRSLVRVLVSSTIFFKLPNPSSRTMPLGRSFESYAIWIPLQLQQFVYNKEFKAIAMYSVDYTCLLNICAKCWIGPFQYAQMRSNAQLLPLDQWWITRKLPMRKVTSQFVFRSWLAASFGAVICVQINWDTAAGKSLARHWTRSRMD
jgi:hypothetical protein